MIADFPGVTKYGQVVQSCKRPGTADVLIWAFCHVLGGNEEKSDHGRYLYIVPQSTDMHARPRFRHALHALTDTGRSVCWKPIRRAKTI